jgi:hypothetical protein
VLVFISGGGAEGIYQYAAWNFPYSHLEDPDFEEFFSGKLILARIIPHGCVCFYVWRRTKAM